MTEPRLIPGAAAALCLTLTLATTVWSAKPVYGPLHAEFGWPPALIVAAEVASLALTAAAMPRAGRFAARRGPRAICTVACILTSLLALLVLPTLTHLWQFAITMLALGGTRAAALAGCWCELRRCAGLRGAAAAALVCSIVSIAVVTPWIAEVVYRNSWREGVVACAGVLLLVCAPVAYILLTGPLPKPSPTD